MKIHENIRKFRLQKHLSQEELGARLGITGQAVSKWEQGLTSPDISLLPPLAECFGVTIDSLFGDALSRRYPGYGGEYNELVALYTAENGTEADFNRAVDALGEAILSGRAATEDYLNYGLLYQVRSYRDNDMALRYYHKAITEGNRNRDLYWMTAHQQITNLLEPLGRLDKAIAEHQSWCDAEPDCAWAHISYAYALSKADRLEEAHREVLQALCLDDNDVNVLTMAGDLYAQMGKYDEAVRYWDKAYICDPSQIACLFSKAEMYASNGQRETAIRQFEEILVWLEAHGYNMQLEGMHPRRRIQELLAQQQEENNGGTS